MKELDFIGALHRSTKRDCRARILRGDRAACTEVAKQFGREYWDGDRSTGYGGYRYDGRWQPVARAIAGHYGLQAGARVLDVGCGKGFLLYDMMAAVPGLEVRGLDVSDYALRHARQEVRAFLDCGHARCLPYPDASFDLVLSINTLHNLPVYELASALGEIERVGRGAAYITVESYRNEGEKDNLLNWQLTCECFYTPEEWIWLFKHFGYTGDYGFIFFE